MYHHTRNRLLSLVVAPAGEPLMLAETKLYLRVELRKLEERFPDVP